MWAQGLPCYNGLMATSAKTREFAERLKVTPTQPGVYLMRDATSGIIYVGKAASLRNRLRSYFQRPSGKEPKVRRMMAKIADFEYIVTETESEALILENLLIKRHKPVYNARLKDDKTYPYIKIDLNEEFPQLYFTRRVLADGARYFGPFASASSVRKTMDLLNKLFPYRSCTKVITGTDERPCLEYYIHRCVAPCIGAVDRQEYQRVIRQVIMFLEGDTDPILRNLRRTMREASDAMQFERAAGLRDQVRAIESVSESQKIVSSRNENEDVLALASDQGEVWVELFNIRRGKLVGRDHFLMEGGEDEEPARLLEMFIQQFYGDATSVPPSLLVQYPLANGPLVQEWLSGKRGGRVIIRVPQRGEKRRLVAMVAENARQGLVQRRIKWLSESDKVLQARVELQEALSLPEMPDRIECYDISNIQGTNSVGSMVVFEDGRPKTSHYRRFQIKTVEGVDDYSMMQEMLRRRFKRLGAVRQQALQTVDPGDRSPPAHGELVESRVATPDQLADDGAQGPSLGTARVKSRRRRYGGPVLSEAEGPGAVAPDETGIGSQQAKQESWGLVPRLVLIDGGKGHLSAAQQVFLELGITDIPLASIAKQREEIFLPHQPEPVLLPRTSQALYLVQRLRDEAHRFAITYHRQLRSKSATRSALDSVQGIGPKRRRVLLRQFGSVARIREATVDDLAAVPGMTRALAQKVKDGVGGGVEGSTL
jgi:excinuclease ABC subunit C